MELYLDTTPLIRALRETPEEFEMRRGHVVHRASGHGLAFDIDGSARLFAQCSCVELPISKEQSDELLVAATEWEATYWRPRAALEAARRHVAEINRAFARHFQPRSRWQRVLDAVRRPLPFRRPRGSGAVNWPPSIPIRSGEAEAAMQQLELQEFTLF